MKNKLIQKLNLLAIGIVLSLSAPTLAQASAQADFDKAVKFFKSGNYQQAITYFNAAKKQGMDNISLHYNLASSYYKVGNYQKARYHFKLVAKSPKMNYLANYNLALIEVKLGNFDRATAIFSKIIKDNKDEKLVLLSKSKLREIQKINDRWRSYIAFDYGHDDNITSLPSETALDISDNFYNLLLSADAVISGQRQNGWIIDANYFNINYADSGDYDEYQYNFGMKYTNKIYNWDSSSQLSYGQNNFAGDTYQSFLKLEFRANKKLSNNEKLLLRYRYEDINSELSIYDYLEGWRQKARIEYRKYMPSSISKLYYELELNDRNELVTTSYSYDYSPTRHTLRGKYTHKYTRDWHFIGDLSLRLSDFPESSSFDRDDTQIKLSLTSQYYFDKTLRLQAKLEHIDNESTVDTYDYDKNRLLIGISKLF